MIKVAGLCDAIQDDTGLITAITMRMVLANLRGVDLPRGPPVPQDGRPAGYRVLFISISCHGDALSVTFLVIIGTVAIYGLAAAPLARKLSLSEPESEKTPAAHPALSPTR